MFESGVHAKLLRLEAEPAKIEANYCGLGQWYSARVTKNKKRKCTGLENNFGA